MSLLGRRLAVTAVAVVLRCCATCPDGFPRRLFHLLLCRRAGRLIDELERQARRDESTHVVDKECVTAVLCHLLERFVGEWIADLRTVDRSGVLLGIVAQPVNLVRPFPENDGLDPGVEDRLAGMR